jgi:MSHA pilin protein MshD
MGTGQMMLTVMAVFILSTVILSSNRGYVSNTGTIIQTKLNLIATSLATSRVQKASRLAFDQNTRAANDTTAFPNPITLTTQLSATLVAEAGEANGSDTLFNDVDDYNNFIAIDSTPAGDRFRVGSTVLYVDENNPFGPASPSGRTWVKRLDVWVTPMINPRPGEKPDTLRMKQVFGYWRWR